jgi:hypothetical protein
MTASFGSDVKIKSVEETIEKNLAGRTGCIFGETVPSLSRVDVIGKSDDDFALNVFFEELNNSFWFAPELLEPINNGVGTVITLDGVNKKWTKTEQGGWKEEATSQFKKPWWRFW